MLWKFQGGALPSNIIATSVLGLEAHKITIINVSMDNAGNYTCLGTDRNKIEFDSDAVLDVLGKF